MHYWILTLKEKKEISKKYKLWYKLWYKQNIKYLICIMEKNTKQTDCSSCTFEEKSKEIDLIHSLINRMANSQLQTKIFCISIIALIIIITSFFAKSNELTTLFSLCKFTIILTILIFVIESFRALDLNFLRTEKIYRVWYEYVIEIRDTNRENLYLLDTIKIQEILVMHNRIDLTKLKKSTKQSWAFYRMLYCISLLLICLLV